MAKNPEVLQKYEGQIRVSVKSVKKYNYGARNRQKLKFIW